MLDRLYQWTLSKAAHPHAIWWLAFFAFIESIFFPIPADIMLIPMVIAARNRAWILSIVCGLASATGGMAGWAIGFYAYESIGLPIIEFYGLKAEIGNLQQKYQEFGAWIVATGAVSPIPYKLVTIASGFFQMDFWEYNLVSYATRMVRFLVVGGLLYFTGPWIKWFMDRHLKLFTILFFVVLIGGFVLVYFLL